jgi:dihydroorotate dehydrogenase (NAD+) catalytic subunit
MAQPKPDLSVRLGTTYLKTPLVAAAGTVGSVVDFVDTIDFSFYGAAVAKSVSLDPWQGRPTPRLAHAGSGMLNGIGIQNPGIERWLSEVNSRIDGVNTQVWGSVVGHDVAGFVEVARRMDTSSVAAIEVNLSCPNLEGEPFALDPNLSSEVIREVRGATTKPLGAKLSPDASPVSAVAHAVAEAGADWVVMGNTVMGASIDPRTRRPLLSGVTGGYSGAPIRPIAIRCVLEIASDLPEVPIVGCGGISSAEHVIEYILAGATAVAIGTAHFARPRIGKTIIKDLHRLVRGHDAATVDELRGAYEPWT